MKRDILHKFIEIGIPSTVCNLRCHYCYVGQQMDQDKGVLHKFQYSPDYVANALSERRLGGQCLLNFCGAGETLLPPEMPSYIKAILRENHFVSIVTNMTVTKRIDKILNAPKEYLERLFFKCSFHYLEMKRLNLLNKFCDNINKVRDAGCSISIELVPNDELVPYIDEIKEFSLEKFGSLPHTTITRNEEKKSTSDLPILTSYTKEEFERTWDDSFRSEFFSFKKRLWDLKIHEFCYAGKWTFALNFINGEVKQCYSSQNKFQNIYKNINEPIIEYPVALSCLEPFCYNCQSFVSLGVIPDWKLETYADIRDKICIDGSHWLTPRVRNFFSQKLYENNKEYTEEEKEKFRNKNNFRFMLQKRKIAIKFFLKRIRNKVCRLFR
jgi:organic radical activating enzyme